MLADECSGSTSGAASTQTNSSKPMSPTPRPPAITSPVRAFLYEWGLPIVELALRLSAIFLATALLLRAPLPLVGPSLTIVQVLIVFAAVALVGISLYETLFSDHFRP